MDNNKRNSAVPIRAHLAGIAVVGDLVENNTTTRPDHFVIVCVDEKGVARSEKKPRVPTPQWQWPEAHQFQFHPSSTIKITIYRERSIRINKHLVGQYTGKVIDLLENGTTIDLENKAGVKIASKIKIGLFLASEPEYSFESFMKTVDADVSRLDTIVGAPPGILALAKVLQLTKNIMDIVSTVDPSPILKASLGVMSVVYEAINQAERLDESIQDLAVNLREVLAVAKEYPDSLQPIEGTPNVVEEISRASLKVASLIHEYTRPTFIRRILKSQFSDDMKSRIAQCQKSLDTLKQNFDRRVTISTNRQLKTMKDDQQAKMIYEWLSAPDTSRSYNEAREKHQRGTSSWFLDGARFCELQEKGDFLWIKGTAGCGKTLLCSSIIEKIIELHKENTSIAYAYFLFDGRDSQKDLQLHDKLIRSLISQLSHQCDSIPPALVELKGGSYSQQPSTDSLQDTLLRIIDGLHSTYIIIDSLDECTKSEREKTLKWIRQVVPHTKMGNLRLVVSSRPERDIIDALQPLNQHSMDLAKESANHDISMYLDHHIPLVKKWDEETRNIVKSTLTERAQGMFRWVALQLSQLKECSTPRAVREQLNALPKDLYETYERILLKVNKTDHTDTKTFLRWLCFSARPMTLLEISEAVAVDFDAENGPQYNPSHRYWDERDVLEKCSGLITESEGHVKLAHFSIKEYLLSEDLRTTQAIFSFHLTSNELSHSLLSQTCLAYILQFDVLDSSDKSGHMLFALAPYAAKHWIFHAHSGGINKPEPSLTLTLAKSLFTHRAAFINWVHIWDLDNPNTSTPDLKRTNIAPPLYYASSAGLQQVALHLLKEGNVNAQGGNCGNALQAASYRGHTAVVELLLENGADVNMRGGEYDTALHAASIMGYEAVVKLLLENGADVNARGEKTSVFQMSLIFGDEETAKLLLENGADVPEGYGTALLTASLLGYDEVVKLLLENGADAKALRREGGSALMMPLVLGDEATVKLLLENGVDVNARATESSSALFTACLMGRVGMVKLLLEYGADVNELEGNVTPLQGACLAGHDATVKLLLENGADVNVHGEVNTALHVALMPGHEAIVKLLLEKGADANAQGGAYGDALRTASFLGHEAIVKLLLEHGADVHTQGGEYGNALQAALSQGHEMVAKLLRENGADENIKEK